MLSNEYHYYNIYIYVYIPSHDHFFWYLVSI